jgi:hypothetical protein
VDTFAALNTWLAGFFACGAIHYAIQWVYSRHERVLLVFALQLALYAAFCLGMVSFFRATTVAASQAALSRFVTIGVVTHAGFLQIYALLSGRRDRIFRVFLTATLAFLAVLNQWAPLRGTVLALRSTRLPGGATVLVPIRTPPGASLVVLYLVVLVILGYGFLAARTIWKRDRVGSVLMNLATTAILAGASLGILIDFAHVRAPYAGAWPQVIFVLCVSLFLSREYSARGARLAASERRTERALLETRDALANLQDEQRRREEAEVEREKATEGFVRAQRMEIASQLAAGVAHDFNNVLSVMSVWSAVMMRSSRSAAQEEQAR